MDTYRDYLSSDDEDYEQSDDEEDSSSDYQEDDIVEKDEDHKNRNDKGNYVPSDDEDSDYQEGKVVEEEPLDQPTDHEPKKKNKAEETINRVKVLVANMKVHMSPDQETINTFDDKFCRGEKPKLEAQCHICCKWFQRGNPNRS